MTPKDEEKLERQESPPLRLWSKPKLFRMPHALARSNNTLSGPFGDGAFLYS